MKSVHRSFVLSAGAFATYLAVTVALGWKIGGRPPGWYEGKALLFPFLTLAWMCAAAALLGLVYSFAAVRSESKAGVLGWRSLSALGLSAFVSALFVVCSVFPLGLAIAYAVARLRHQM